MRTQSQGSEAQVSGGAEASDLADMLRAFSDVTSRLEETHRRLQAEVTRLRAELGEANAQLARSKRLAALGEMAAGIAHEVRNPLGSIGLYARMLEQDLPDRPQQREMAGRIRASVLGLDAIVSDVLDFSRDLRVDGACVDAQDVLDRAIETCCPQGQRPTDLTIPPPEVEHGSDLWCDAGLLHQALVNVIRNALEAMAERPGPHELAIGASRQTRLTSDRGGDEVIALWVRDTGGGVPDAVRDRMFNPFFTTRRAGTGLGLAIVHRIVDAHGGAVRVENITDEHRRLGARIELLIPAIKAKPTTGIEVNSTHRPAEIAGDLRRHVA